jgi:hypothetical protein
MQNPSIEKPEIDDVLHLVNEARKALLLRPLPELPKGVAPEHLYECTFRDPDEPPGYVDPNLIQYRKEVKRFIEAGAMRRFSDADQASLGWLKHSDGTGTAYSPIGIALHSEPNEEVAGEWVFVLPRKVAEVLSLAFGTQELPFGSDRRLRLPKELNNFMSCYISGLYPELTAPSPAELYFYLLQSEVDAKDLHEGLYGRSPIRSFARGVVLVLAGVFLAHFIGC